MRSAEFIVPERPVTVQTKKRARLQDWKQDIVFEALEWWPWPLVTTGEVHLSIVFLCDPIAPIDVDNIIKPIQDALLSVIYTNDVLVTDVESHRRYTDDTLDLTDVTSKLLAQMLNEREEAVYISVREANALGSYL